jgi:aminoglycoside phosphotransferase (APT) family kinase protein
LEPLGIDVTLVERWCCEHVKTLTPPLRYHRITGGLSNLTYLVTDADGARCVLRRPPVGDLLATAHDVTREYRIMAALVASGVPVPPMLEVCEDPMVTGAPFYVMAHVDGIVVHTAAQARALFTSEAARRRVGETVVDTLVALHDVNVDAVGLGQLSRREGYLERQLNRWSAQSEACHLVGIGDMATLHQWLVANRPPESPCCLVHGDFRLGNVLLGADGVVLSVLDWELCSLGDPLADVAYFLWSWSAADARAGHDGLLAAVPGFLSVGELGARYAGSGRSLHHLDYWMAFTAWRAAAILAGVYRRYLDVQMATHPMTFPRSLSRSNPASGRGCNSPASCNASRTARHRGSPPGSLATLLRWTSRGPSLRKSRAGSYSG